jgi:DNA polymerase III subunit epsilon
MEVVTNSEPACSEPAPAPCYLVFDTETTGLPRFERGVRGFPPPTRLRNYDGSRVVSVAWLVVRASDHVVLAEGGGLIRPEGFAIPPEATRVHGISTERALAEGEPFAAVRARFLAAMARCDEAVGHNVDFDVSVLGAEFARRGYVADLDRLQFRMRRVCTMALARSTLGLSSNPRLGVLYERLFGRPMEGALHDAAVDTLACYRCLVKLRGMAGVGPAAFQPGRWRVQVAVRVASEPKAEAGDEPQAIRVTVESEEVWGAGSTAKSEPAATGTRSVAVECSSLEEVANVCRGAARWLAAKYPGRRIEVAPRVLRQGEHELSTTSECERPATWAEGTPSEAKVSGQEETLAEAA